MLLNCIVLLYVLFIFYINLIFKINKPKESLAYKFSADPAQKFKILSLRFDTSISVSITICNEAFSGGECLCFSPQYS